MLTMEAEAVVVHLFEVIVQPEMITLLSVPVPPSLSRASAIRPSEERTHLNKAPTPACAQTNKDNSFSSSGVHIPTNTKNFIHPKGHLRVTTALSSTNQAQE